MAYEETKRPSWVLEGEQWSGSETQEQYEKAGKKLAPGVSSVLPSAPVQRYGDPYKMFTDYQNAGGKKTMTDWESAGRPGGDILDAGAEGDIISGLDITAPTEEEQQSIKDKVAKQFQAQIDAIDAYYNELASQEAARGASRLATGLGKVKSVQARSGLLDTPMGEAQRVAEERGQQEYTAGNVKLLKAEQDLKKAAVLDKIDTRAQQTIDAQKAEAEANYTKAEAYKTKVRNEARSDIDTLAQTTALDVFKANKGLYDQLKFESGFKTDLEFDTYYESKAKSGATQIDTNYKGTNGNTWIKRIMIYPNGKRVEQNYDMGIPFQVEADYGFMTNETTGGVYYYDKKNPEGGLTNLGNIGAKPKGTTDESEWEVMQQAVSAGNAFASDKIGEDGKLNPDDFKKLRKAWGADGLSDKDFIENFRKYVNTDREDYESVYQIKAAEIYQ